MSYLYENSNLNNYVTERFRRPSKCQPVSNPYTFQDFVKEYDAPPFVTAVFHKAIDVIKAYFAILENASNMPGFLGGCGSIGDALLPYPYAYELLSNSLQKQMPLEEFIHSFQGIGYITLLKLYPVYGSNETTCYYMFEMEAITGPSENQTLTSLQTGSYFVYHYGIMAVENTGKSGFKIDQISCLPEDFLCAPDHGWVYSATYLVTAVYKDWYNLITKIEYTTCLQNMIYVYATGHGKIYRFDFVRLTNGYDILLHENICTEDGLKEVNLIRSEDQRMKFSPFNPDLRLHF